MQRIKLGLINPTPHNLEKIFYLIDHGYIDLDNLEITGIYHESQHKSIESTNEFIEERGYANISISTIRNFISFEDLFTKNDCSNEFEELFFNTDGLIFLGGDDISPKLYGEKTFLTTEQITNERNWEISFLFHLIGGYQNVEFVPLLEKKPDYLILGICLGMQEMNVASGGTLYQDIPFQIYEKEDYESVLNQDMENQHKNYQGRINNLGDKGSITQFHHIKITPDSILSFGQIQNPLVTSTHHQSIKKVGKNFQIIATSMDNKVIEAICNSKYKNVYGTQFHPEFSILYEQQGFVNSKNETLLPDDNNKLFHPYFWSDFSNRLKKIRN